MTATTGRTVLAIVAILSLLLSAFAIARPVIAAHGDGEPEVTGYRDASRENEGGNITDCLYGATLVRFDSAQDSDSASGTIDGIPYTIEYTITDGKLTFEATGALVTEALIKGGPATTIYDYSSFPGGGIAHDDGLIALEGGISNVGFCLIPIEASILVYKTDQTNADVAAAEFTVYDGATVVGGPTATNADGLVCFDGLVLDKTYTVTETDAPDGYIGDPDSQTVAASLGNCEDRIAAGDAVDATFTNTLLGAIVIYKTDQTGANVEGATFTVEGKDGTFTTAEDGTFCVDGLVVGDTVTVTETIAPDGYELANPASQEVNVTQAGDCDDHDGTPDATFTNNLLGSLLVLKTDDSDEPLEGAEFSITGPAEFSDTATSDADGWFCIDGLTYGAEYTVTETAAPDGYEMDANNPQQHVIDDAADCDERVANSPVADLVFVNAEEAEAPDGSVTIIKDLGDCEICETETPGRWFNQSPGTTTTPGTEFANASLGADPITVAGITFSSVADVHEHADPGSLLWHYLGLQMNVRWGMDAECDLAGLVYAGADAAFHGWTVGQILAEAEKVLNGEASDYTAQQLHDVVAEINESDTGDGTLICPAENGDGTVGVGYEFELWVAAEYDGGMALDSGTTDATGSLTFSGLDLGVEYLLVEVGGPNPDETCRVVSATGTGVSFDAETGLITFTLTEELVDLTISVTNECEVEEEEEFDVDLLKVDQDDNALAGVAFELTGDGYFATDTTDGDGAIYFDGIVAGEYVLTETTSAPGCESAGPWMLTVGADGSFTFDPELATTDGGAFVIVNLCEDDQPETGIVEIDKLFCITSGEAETEFFVFDPTIPGDVGTQGLVEDEQPDEGCWSEAVAFTITGGDLTEPMHVTTGDDGILEFDLAVSANAYLITEDATGASAEFWVEADPAVTVILVINWIPEAAENGTVKVIKLFCETDDAAEAGVEFSVEGGDVAVPVLQGCTVGDATFEFGDDTFSVGADGLAIFTAEVGEYDFAEIAPNAAVYAGTVPVVEGEFTTVIVFNTFVEDEQAGGGGGGTAPGQSETPREGTAGGNPLPNTATTPAPGGSLPAILLALMALGALAVGGQRVAAEARSRR